MRSPTLVPRHDQFDVTVHIVLEDFGKLGRAYRETDEAKADLRDVVEGILSGEYERPIRVVAFNTVDGWSRDLSEDVAGAVVEKARSEQLRLPKGTQQFLEAALDEELEPELCMEEAA